MTGLTENILSQFRYFIVCLFMMKIRGVGFALHSLQIKINKLLEKVSAFFNWPFVR